MTTIVTTDRTATLSVRSRVRRSALATLVAWAAASLYTLVFEVPEVWRNAYPGSLAYDLSVGLALWLVFTFAVCLGVWCVVVLPIALAVSSEVIVRRRRAVEAGASAIAVLFVGWRLGTWSDLFHRGPENPVAAPLFLEYAGFSLILAAVTTVVYARLLSSPAKR